MKHSPLLILILALAAAASAANVIFPPGSGVMNVKDYGAKGDGITDDTGAFRKALKAVQMHFQIIYVPNGTYLVTDTISWGAWITLQGQNRGQTIIRLKDNCPGYADPARPKPVMHAAMPGNKYGNDSWANAAFDNYVLNLTIDTGKGNPGAVALRYTTHNQGVVEEVSLRSGDGKGVMGLDLRTGASTSVWITAASRRSSMWAATGRIRWPCWP